VLLELDHAIVQSFIEAARSEGGGKFQLTHADFSRMRLEMGDQARANARLLQLGIDEQRAQPVAAERDGADDALAPLADEHVAFGHALAQLGRGEVGHDQLDGLPGIVAAVGCPHRVLHQRADRGHVIGRGAADHEIGHDPP
jgi:hypothetical protein